MCGKYKSEIRKKWYKEWIKRPGNRERKRERERFSYFTPERRQLLRQKNLLRMKQREIENPDLKIKRHEQQRKLWRKNCSQKTKYMQKIEQRTRIKFKWLKLFGCMYCGKFENIEFHHFSYEEPHGEFIVLCRQCHAKIHRRYDILALDQL